MEEVSGVAVVFRRFTFGEKRKMPLTTKFAAASLDATKQRSVVAFPSSTIEERACIHELLHLKRWLIDGIPQLAPNPNGQLAGNEAYFRVDNDLEHLAIVPVERCLVGGGDYWDNELLATVKRWRRRGNVVLDLLLNAALTRILVPGSEAEAICAQQLSEEGLLTRADEFCLILASTQDKRMQIQSAVKHLHLRPQDLQLQWYDRRRREYLAGPLV